MGPRGKRTHHIASLTRFFLFCHLIYWFIAVRPGSSVSPKYCNATRTIVPSALQHECLYETLCGSPFSVSNTFRYALPYVRVYARTVCCMVKSPTNLTLRRTFVSIHVCLDIEGLLYYFVPFLCHRMQDYRLHPIPSRPVWVTERFHPFLLPHHLVDT